MNSNRHFIFHFVCPTQRTLSLKEGNFSSELICWIICCVYNCIKSHWDLLSLLFPGCCPLTQQSQCPWTSAVWYVIILMVHPDWPSRSCQLSDKPYSRVNSISKALGAVTGSHRTITALLKFSEFPEYHKSKKKTTAKHISKTSWS